MRWAVRTCGRHALSPVCMPSSADASEAGVSDTTLESPASCGCLGPSALGALRCPTGFPGGRVMLHHTMLPLLHSLLQLGADVIELGVPYSDPLADGPTIQAAATRALQQGATLDKVGASARRGAERGARHCWWLVALRTASSIEDCSTRCRAVLCCAVLWARAHRVAEWGRLLGVKASDGRALGSAAHGGATAHRPASRLHWLIRPAGLGSHATRHSPPRLQVLAVVREASATIKAPLVMFTYYNPIMARGLDKFCQQAKEAGASGEGSRG